MFHQARTALSMLSLAALVGLGAGCASAEGSADNGATGDDQSAAAVTSSHAECITNTLFFTEGMTADFEGAVGATFITNPGGNFFKHIAIPHVLDAVIGTADFGNPIDTFTGFEIKTEELPQGSKATPRIIASVDAGPNDDARLTMATKRYQVAKGIFDALTRATETSEHHVAPQNSYDRSFDQTKRASANGRIVCTATTFPGTGEARPTYACQFFGLTQTLVQSYDTAQAGGFCPTK